MDTADHTAPEERVPRCAHTRLTKPECHCLACLAAQVAAHGPVAAQGIRPLVAPEPAAGA
jgi:hypothetical protein